MKKELEGCLLVASPGLRDPNFVRTVVLLISHGEDGAFGLVLNRPTKIPLSKVWSETSGTACQTEERLHLGGPVEGPLMAIHTDEAHSEAKLLPGAFFSTMPENLRELVAGKAQSVRFFAGYAGWAAEQLENELNEGAWQIVPAKAEHLFHNDPDLWDRVRREITTSNLLSTLKIDRIPPDPRLN